MPNTEGSVRNLAPAAYAEAKARLLAGKSVSITPEQTAPVAAPVTATTSTSSTAKPPTPKPAFPAHARDMTPEEYKAARRKFHTAT